jgi:hypothetical protein
MDEVEEAHSSFVFPKLSRRCSQIIDDQVWVCRAVTKPATGTPAIC